MLIFFSKIEKQDGRHIKIGKFDFSIFYTRYSHVVHQMKAYEELNAYLTQ